MYATGSDASMSTAGRVPVVAVMAVRRGPVAALTRPSPAARAATTAMTTSKA